MVKKNNWNLQEMQETLVKDTEQRISDGFHEIVSEQGEAYPLPLPERRGEKHHPSPLGGGRGEAPLPSEQEPTKGVQTYIPMSMYRRLNDIKLSRRENIAALAAQAIELWLDVQEGKKKVSATT